jgi:hypothetical protein
MFQLAAETQAKQQEENLAAANRDAAVATVDSSVEAPARKRKAPATPGGTPSSAQAHAVVHQAIVPQTKSCVKVAFTSLVDCKVLMDRTMNGLKA